MNIKKHLIIIIILVAILVLGAILGTKIYLDKRENHNSQVDIKKEETNTSQIEETKIEEKEPEIFNGKDRPIAVMIDNHTGAWPQAGLNKTYLVYEIIVEGGETRLMALFKGQDVDVIGPVRSSRHYFLDYEWKMTQYMPIMDGVQKLKVIYQLLELIT